MRVASGRMCCAASAWSDRFYAGDGRGVADETSDGQWKVLLCRQCSIFAANALSLVTRCQLCRRYATFGPAGGSRSDALHCKRHRQVRGGRRIDATDSRGGKGDRNVDPKIRGESGWRKRGEMQRIRGWGRAWTRGKACAGVARSELGRPAVQGAIVSEGGMNEGGREGGREG